MSMYLCPIIHLRHFIREYLLATSAHCRIECQRETRFEISDGLMRIKFLSCEVKKYFYNNHSSTYLPMSCGPVSFV